MYSTPYVRSVRCKFLSENYQLLTASGRVAMRELDCDAGTRQ